MKLRRIRTADGLQLQTSTEGTSWQPTEDRSALGGRVFDPEWELARADEHLFSVVERLV